MQRLQEGKEGYVPSQSDGRENTGVLEDIRFYKKLKNVSCEYTRLNG